MKKTIRLSESELINLIQKIITEQVSEKDINPKNLKFGDRGPDVTALQQKLMNMGFLKLKSGKPTQYFGNLTNSALARALGKPEPKLVVKPTQNKKDSVVVSKNTNPNILKQIDFKNLSTTDTTKQICKPGIDPTTGKETTECAQFVNNFSDRFNNVGNAWLAHDTDSVGSRIYSIYEKIDQDDIKTYIDLYKKVMSNKIKIDEIKNFNEKLLSKGNALPTLQPDDVVGLYYKPSSHHIDAFKSSGKSYFKNGDPSQPGKTLLGGRGFSFNTHVGIVGAIKNGVPLIFHNIHGTVQSDPINKLNIAWVKRGKSSNVSIAENDIIKMIENLLK